MGADCVDGGVVGMGPSIPSKSCGKKGFFLTPLSKAADLLGVPGPSRDSVTALVRSPLLPSKAFSIVNSFTLLSTPSG
jgi:hypothetical protein